MPSSPKRTHSRSAHADIMQPLRRMLRPPSYLPTLRTCEKPISAHDPSPASSMPSGPIVARQSSLNSDTSSPAKTGDRSVELSRSATFWSGSLPENRLCVSPARGRHSPTMPKPVWLGKRKAHSDGHVLSSMSLTGALSQGHAQADARTPIHRILATDATMLRDQHPLVWSIMVRSVVLL